MPLHKQMLIIEDDDYQLIAVHSSLEAYQLAFLLNKNLGLKLKRERQDVDFRHKELTAFYPLYHFFDPIRGCEYYLVSNKFKGSTQHSSPSGALFPEETLLSTHLIPAYKKVDYFLKIEDETAQNEMQSLVRSLNNVPKIITAYEVETATLKSKENLIFN